MKPAILILGWAVAATPACSNALPSGMNGMDASGRSDGDGASQMPDLAGRTCQVNLTPINSTVQPRSYQCATEANDYYHFVAVTAAGPGEQPYVDVRINFTGMLHAGTFGASDMKCAVVVNIPPNDTFGALDCPSDASLTIDWVAPPSLRGSFDATVPRQNPQMMTDSMKVHAEF